MSGHLRLVDADGSFEELSEDPRLRISQLEAEVDGLSTEVKSLAAKNEMLKRDKVKAARRSATWLVGERLFVLWLMASGRDPLAKNCARFRFDRWALVETFLSDGSEGPTEDEPGPPRNDFERCAAAIVGRCYDHFTTKRANGRPKHFNEWERIFANSGEFDDSLERRPRDWRERMTEWDPGEMAPGPRKLEV